MDAPENFSILLVDDDTLVIRILSRMLTPFAPLRFATSGRVAIQLALASVPDLVLLDVDMPEFSGPEVCNAFKQHSALRRVPIILVTGHDSPELRRQALRLGAVDLLTKPPDVEQLRSRVRTVSRLKWSPGTPPESEAVDVLPHTAPSR